MRGLCALCLLLFATTALTLPAGAGVGVPFPLIVDRLALPEAPNSRVAIGSVAYFEPGTSLEVDITPVAGSEEVDFTLSGIVLPRIELAFGNRWVLQLLGPAGSATTELRLRLDPASGELSTPPDEPVRIRATLWQDSLSASATLELPFSTGVTTRPACGDEPEQADLVGRPLGASDGAVSLFGSVCIERLDNSIFNARFIWQLAGTLVLACSDGLDNDGDGDVDFPRDPGCTSAADPTESTVCSDGLDNDEDGLVDYPADPGCSDENDFSERTGTECDDGLDNDGDGFIDFPDDTGCATLGSPFEAACGDGILDPGEDCEGAGECCSGCRFVSQGDSCFDGDLCTLGDRCDGAGQCVPGPPRVCDDGSFCTGVETCDPALGCRFGVPPSAAELSDGVDCTEDRCDPETDAPIHTPRDEACDDGSFCTGVETCDPALGCRIGVPPSAAELSDGVACTEDRCDPQTDAPIHTPRDEACDDGSFCTGVEACDPALGCRMGVPPSAAELSDGVACTEDRCDPQTDAPIHTPRDEACDDGSFCTGVETCDPAVGCRMGVPPSAAELSDGVDCTEDRCDPQTDVPVHTPRDEACDDGDVCNGTEACDPVWDCQPAAPPDPDDIEMCSEPVVTLRFLGIGDSNMEAEVHLDADPGNVRWTDVVEAGTSWFVDNQGDGGSPAQEWAPSQACNDDWWGLRVEPNRFGKQAAFIQLGHDDASGSSTCPEGVSRAGEEYDADMNEIIDELLAWDITPFVLVPLDRRVADADHARIQAAAAAICEDRAPDGVQCVRFDEIALDEDAYYDDVHPGQEGHDEMAARVIDAVVAWSPESRCDASCDDADECTSDWCDESGCQHTPIDGCPPLLRNGAFTTSLDGWELSGDGEAVWSMLDGRGATNSGSAVVIDRSDEVDVSGLRQCIVLENPGPMAFGGSILVPVGQDRSGWAVLALQTFASKDCTGDATAVFATPLVATPGAWTFVEAPVFTPPAQTGSGFMTAVSAKIGAGGQLAVVFDEIEIPEPSAGLMAWVALGVLAGFARLRFVAPRR